MLTINTKTKRFTLKGDEEQSERLFGLLVAELLNLAGGDIPEVKENKEPRENYKPLKAHLENERDEHTYKGFLYIRCPECGAEKGQCSKKGMHSIHCDNCGCNEEFAEPLIPMYLNCECGGRYKYMTNKKEEMFDIPCLNCGAPVPIRYNGKKNIYETIQ